MSQRLKIALIVLLVLGNAVLLFLVTQKMADSRIDAGARRDPTPPAPTRVVTPEPRPEPGGRQSLVVADDDTIFRLLSGSCDGEDAPDITFSANSGASFGEVGLPEDVRAVFALTARNADDLDLVAAERDCDPVRYASKDGGESWEAAKGANAWFLDPRTKNVMSPDGKVNTECNDNLVLSAVSDRVVRVFCASGVLVGSGDAGQTWNRLGVLDGVKAAAYVSEESGFALAPDGGCASGSYTSEDGGRTWVATGCLDAAPARAMAANRDVVAAIAGSTVYVSEDGGRTWTKTRS